MYTVKGVKFIYYILMSSLPYTYTCIHHTHTCIHHTCMDTYITHALTHTPHMHAMHTYDGHTRFDLFFVLLDECNEVVDYAIAQKIVELHVKQKESIHRVYSQVTCNLNL